jgi:hypothetical protein
MTRVVLRSRSGNVVLAALGAIYTVTAIAALVAFVADVWNALGLSDLALQIGLIAAAACGVWLLQTGLENLGVHVRKGLPHFTHRSSGSH